MAPPRLPRAEPALAALTPPDPGIRIGDAPGVGAWADALLRRRTAELAESAEAPDDRAPALPLLVGRGMEALYGVELSQLARVVPLPRVARVPGAPPELLGLIAIDGRVMRLFDVDLLCGRPAVPAGSGFAVVLRRGLSGGGYRPLALRLRSVEAVVEQDPARLVPPPEPEPYISAITDQRVAVLDVGAILDRLRSTREE